MEALEPLVEGTERSYQQGLDFWFVPPGSPNRPVRWKMMLPTLLALWPTILLLSWLLAPIDRHVPFPFTPLVMLAVMVPLLEFVLMPAITRLLGGWLYQR